MTRIYNSTTEETVWRGEEYLVNGHPAGHDLPSHLHYLADVELPSPEIDEATHKLVRFERMAGNEWRMGYDAVPLTAEEIEDRKPKPHPVTPRQFWLALYASDGITKETVEILLTDNIPALIELRESLEIDPTHPLIASLAAHPAIDKTPEEIAALFLHAATL
jgi:hypothetical protein